MNAWTTIRSHCCETGYLLRKYGALLLVMLLGARLAETLLMHLAVQLGMMHRFAGLIAVVMIILLQLVVFAGVFVVLRDRPTTFRLPRKHQAPESPSGHDASSHPVFASALLAVLIPFYGYYAGWGFLGNTLRDYSRSFIDEQWNRVDFQNPDAIGPAALQVDGTLWLLIPVAIIWFIRRRAKALHASTGRGVWPLVVVACEACWVILGLYVLSTWKGQFISWLANLSWLTHLLDAMVPVAGAAVSEASLRPVDWPPPWQLWDWLKELFRYALLPLIWFNLGAIVYGHDLSKTEAATQRVAGGVMNRWAALPKPVTDFIGHFWMGMVKRWHAVANGVLLAASAGVWLTVSILCWWRLADWLGRWSWVGLAQLIGPQESQVWALAAVPLNLLFGMPGQPQNGVVVLTVQFCVLAAGLSMAMSARKAPKAIF